MAAVSGAHRARTAALRGVWLGVTLGALGACAPRPAEKDGARRAASRPSLPELIQALSNQQVLWDGSPVGYMPFLQGEAPQRVLEQGGAALPALLDALEDPERFVVAHVLLTHLAGVRYQAFPRWNGLALELREDLPPAVEPSQRFALEKRWRRWAASHPRPDTLPDA